MEQWLTQFIAALLGGGAVAGVIIKFFLESILEKHKQEFLRKIEEERKQFAEKQAEQNQVFTKNLSDRDHEYNKSQLLIQLTDKLSALPGIDDKSSELTVCKVANTLEILANAFDLEYVPKEQAIQLWAYTFTHYYPLLEQWDSSHVGTLSHVAKARIKTFYTKSVEEMKKIEEIQRAAAIAKK